MKFIGGQIKKKNLKVNSGSINMQQVFLEKLTVTYLVKITCIL